MSTTETIVVENIRCGGCVNSITQALMAIPGVQHVLVQKETEKVCVTGIGINRFELVSKLASLGYPESGNNSIRHRARSLVSCAVGKIN